jgi:kumamolisin
MIETHVELPGSRRPAKSGARRLRDVDPHAHVEVTITLKAPDLPEADALPDRALSPKEFAERYGAAPADVQKVEQVLRGFGLTVDEVVPSGRSLRVSGTAAAMEAAFQPDLAIYHSADQGEFRGREGTIKIPAELEGLITGVLGLDQRRVARRKAASAEHPLAAAGTAPVTPTDLETRYNFPAGDGAGQTIAIAEFGAPMQAGGAFVPPAYLPDDVTKFCAEQGRPTATVQIVPVNLAPLTLAQLQQLPAPQRNAAADETGEVMMDIEIIAALCPKASINVYFATFDQKGWVDLLDQVTAAHPALPVSLSISWGEAEDSPDWSDAARQAINARFQAAAMLGITVCVSSGDDGSGDGLSGNRAHVDFPASSPFVLGVGGTMLSGAGEVVWWEAPGRRTNKGGGATGGGVSVLFPRPTWQTVTVTSLNLGSIDGRVVPDVAALAGPPLYELILAGRSAPNGGTSASAPLWAALIARINAGLPSAKQQRFLTPLLYQHGSSGRVVGQAAFRDITRGQNASHPQPGKGFSAGPGYDAVSGWGVPNGTALQHEL